MAEQTTKSKTTVISEGMSFAYLVHGTIVMVLSVVATFFYGPSIVVFLVGVALILAGSGVEVAPDKASYRNYISFYGIRLGPWKKLEGVNRLELRETTSQYRKRTFITTLVAGTGEIVSHKTFDVVIWTEDGHEHVINDFNKYPDAKRCLKVLEKTTGIAAKDYYAEETAKLWERRKFRRR